MADPIVPLSVLDLAGMLGLPFSFAHHFAAATTLVAEAMRLPAAVADSPTPV